MNRRAFFTSCATVAAVAAAGAVKPTKMSTSRELFDAHFPVHMNLGIGCFAGLMLAQINSANNLADDTMVDGIHLDSRDSWGTESWSLRWRLRP